MNAIRLCILLAAVIALPTCKESPMHAKKRFIEELTVFIHEVEQKSTYFRADQDWTLYESRWNDFRQLEYLKHYDYMNLVERQQVDSLIGRYRKAKGKYWARRFNERLDTFSSTIKAFLSTS